MKVAALTCLSALIAASSASAGAPAATQKIFSVVVDFAPTGILSRRFSDVKRLHGEIPVELIVDRGDEILGLKVGADHLIEDDWFDGCKAFRTTPIVGFLPRQVFRMDQAPLRFTFDGTALDARTGGPFTVSYKLSGDVFAREVQLRIERGAKGWIVKSGEGRLVTAAEVSSDFLGFGTTWPSFVSRAPAEATEFEPRPIRSLREAQLLKASLETAGKVAPSAR